MPVKWTPELDAIILHSVFEEYNVTVSKPLCTKIAERLKAAGTDCTPKAIEGRLYGWKKKNNPGNAASGTSSAKSMTTTAAAAPKTPTSRTKMVPKKNNNKNQKSAARSSASSSPDNALDDRGSPVSPSAGRGKRARKMQDVEDESEGEDEEEVYVPMGKRVKIEPMDDEGVSFLGGEEGEV